VTDGDSIVHFRRSDVTVTGAIFSTTSYPRIDTRNAGSIQGELEALNAILDRTVYKHDEEDGTMIIPGHGRLCDEWEAAEYRDMLVIIRDRVQDLIQKGAALDRVKAARVTVEESAEAHPKELRFRIGGAVIYRGVSPPHGPLLRRA